MKYLNRLLTLLTLSLTVSLIFSSYTIAQNSCCGGGRYSTPIYPTTVVDENIFYRSAYDYLGNVVDLSFDVYRPVGDNCTARPAAIFYYGGGFYQGDTSEDYIVMLCDTLAQMGYVTFAFEYREGFATEDFAGFQGPYPTCYDTEEAERTVYRCIQDGKEAVKHVKSMASIYDIDTNYVFIGGASAGGFISMGVAYMDNYERPVSTYDINYAWYLFDGILIDRPDMGLLDDPFSYPGISSNVAGVLDLVGAVQDTSIIEGPNDPPIIIYHGNADDIVAYNYDYPYGGQLNSYPMLYGGEPIAQRANNLGMNVQFTLFDGADHDISPYMSEIILGSTLFFEQIICSSVNMCPEDVNGDGSITVQDILSILGEFGCINFCENDVNNDEYVTVADLLMVLSLFGSICG
ncbi:MAG TPA: hypothetical protein EYN67_19865 [Flavobacteriales bacterium]|jgi:acetyl esterase/lipase|nr:hypothetical protein [Flavobacteriales bacterium]